MKEAAEYEAQDKKRKEGIDARNDADSMVFQTEKALDEVGDKISESDKAAVKADLEALKEAINRAPIDQMTDAPVSYTHLDVYKRQVKRRSLATLWGSSCALLSRFWMKDLRMRW